MISSRRSFLAGAGALLIASPAIVRASSLMPIKSHLSDAEIYFAQVEKYQRILAAKMEAQLFSIMRDPRPIPYSDIGIIQVTQFAQKALIKFQVPLQ